MALPTITVQFSGGSGAGGSPASFTVRAPSPEIEAPVTTPAAIARTQGGSLIQFQVGQSFWEVTLPLDHLSNADKNNLESFFRNNITTSWTYTDENGTAFTAQFMDQTLALHKSYRNLWSCKVRLNLSAVLN